MSAEAPYSVESTFTGTGVSEAVQKRGFDPLDVAVSEGSGVVVIQWFKNSQWEDIETLTIGTPTSALHARGGTLFRLECTTFTSGPIKYQLG